MTDQQPADRDGESALASHDRGRDGSMVGRRILVVDDDDALRLSLVRFLVHAGFTVVEVDRVSRALIALDASPFDVVVSDVNMPDGGGLELLRAVRRIDLDVPVILITGDPTLEAAMSAVEYSAFRYLARPLDGNALIATVEDAAQAHALARLRRDAFDIAGGNTAADRARLEVRFERALDGIWLAFQPIIHASTGRLFGAEALMRSTEPSMPTPAALLDAAVHLERVAALGRKVRSRSAAAVTAWDTGMTLFVNLHPEDLFDSELIEASSPLSAIAPHVVLEITERASLPSTANLPQCVARLRALGFRLAVDDIGAGYSGLSSFTELTPEVVKIDMSLVRDVHRSTLKQRTIRALCGLCHEVGTLVVGEGVETDDERSALVDLGCDLLQGYLLGRPNPALPHEAIE
jgi:EAL domain-containing protein (putative c-di-GMP-specific phosphodiesterase class I)/CheY-like chemotaxis protein